MKNHHPGKTMTPWNPAAILSVLMVIAETLSAQPAIIEQSKHIPVAHHVDVLVVGGSTAGVAAACEARRNGASVFLISDRPYVGVDMCAYQRLWLEPEEKPAAELGEAVFGESRSATPLTVKKAMDEALLKAGVPYLTGCYATEALFDENGNIAGAVMANRSGRQAVKAKVVIDGSRHAVITRQTNAKFREFKPGKKTFRFVVVGGEMKHSKNFSSRKLDVTYDSPTSGRGPVVKYPVYEYTISIDMKDGSPASIAAAEQIVRNLVTGKGAKDCSEALYFIPDDTVIGESRISGSWPGGPQCDVSAYRPRGVPRLYVLGVFADMGKEAAQKMLRPLEFMAIGRRIGREAATLAKTLPSADKIELPGQSPDSGDIGYIGEDLRGLRASKQLGTICSRERSLPVFGQYDVVVVGGGTSGAPAGISAARRGSKTLVVEYLDELGGVGTAGLIGSYWRGNRSCFTEEIDIKKVQQQMAREGVLQSRVIHDRDSYPMDDSVISGAVEDVKELSRQHDQRRKVVSKSMKALAVIMAHPERSRSLLREAYKKSPTRNQRTNYAKVLAILGDNTGVPLLIAEVDAQTQWDEGYPYTSGRKVGNVFSDLDRLIIALGYSGDPRALEPVLRKTAILKPETVLSHYKAVTFALRRFRDSQAIEPLAKLLKKPGIGEHAVTRLVGTEAGAVGLPPRRSFKQLNAAFKEIIIAATLYQCGDYQGIGRTILEQYKRDVNGHFASYAQAVLNGKGVPE